jgi:hypothetical protein
VTGGGVTVPGDHGERGDSMDLSLETRINALLTQLENPHLEGYEVEAIKEKIQFLQSLQEQH